MSISMSKRNISLFTLACATALAGALLVGCGPAESDAAPAAEDVAATQQALGSCSGSVVRSGTITNQFGAAIGNIQLYYSTASHAICGQASFYSAPSSFQICATNNTNPSMPPQCQNYSGATSGTTPPQVLAVGDTGSTSVFVSGPLGSGGAGFYTRTF